MIETNIKRIDPGTALAITGAPKDVPTILVSGIAGVQMDDFTAKVSFFEQSAEADGTVMGRVVVTLAIGRSGLTQLRDTFTGVIDAVAAAEAEQLAKSAGSAQ